MHPTSLSYSRGGQTVVLGPETVKSGLETNEVMRSAF